MFPDTENSFSFISERTVYCITLAPLQRDRKDDAQKVEHFISLLTTVYHTHTELVKVL